MPMVRQAHHERPLPCRGETPLSRARGALLLLLQWYTPVAAIDGTSHIGKALWCETEVRGSHRGPHQASEGFLMAWIYKHRPVLERFLSNVDTNGSNGCWLWTKYQRHDGYGNFNVDGKQILAHRWAYINLVGPIPEGLYLDHLCRNRPCVNPSHLEPVTNKVNILRGIGATAINALKTHCPRGHPYDLFNTYKTEYTGRQCRTCKNMRPRWSM